ncbi:hypothetical protein ACSDR0_29200 [Streptosporangium sp. G11]|uniref:hypothetical protein n=1 Tax=Streptosporangium sp. G11 TaxID=3436926 RepID=UPI003EBD3028
MTDPHRVPGNFETPPSARPAGARDGMVRPVLWLLLAAGALCVMVAFSADAGVLAGIGAGLLTLACAAALIIHHYLRLRR